MLKKAALPHGMPGHPGESLALLRLLVIVASFRKELSTSCGEATLQ